MSKQTTPETNPQSVDDLMHKYINTPEEEVALVEIDDDFIASMEEMEYDFE